MLSLTKLNLVGYVPIDRLREQMIAMSGNKRYGPLCIEGNPVLLIEY